MSVQLLSEGIHRSTGRIQMIIPRVFIMQKMECGDKEDPRGLEEDGFSAFETHKVALISITVSSLLTFFAGPQVVNRFTIDQDLFKNLACSSEP
jgi:hypothetical protein